MRAVAVLIILMLAGCGSAPTASRSATAPEPAEPETPTSALDQMELVFEGDYSRQEIQSKLDESFALYGLDPTEENYSRAGSVLVALSNNAIEQGCAACTEMAILDYLIQTGTLEGVEWHEAAALSSSFLAAESQ